MHAQEARLCRAFLLSKLLGALLVEDSACTWASFSPPPHAPQRPLCLWRLWQMWWQTLRQIVGLGVCLDEWQNAPELWERFLDAPRKRQKQGDLALRGAPFLTLPP